MMATEQTSDSFRDDGPLNGAEGLLARRFRLWRGPDGRRQVYSVYAVDEAPDYPGAVAMAVRTNGDGRVPLWSGPAGARARLMARTMGADEIHLRILPDTNSGPMAPV